MEKCQGALVVLQLMSIEHSVANVVFYFSEPLRSETKHEDYNYTITKQVTQYIIRKLMKPDLFVWLGQARKSHG